MPPFRTGAPVGERPPGPRPPAPAPAVPVLAQERPTDFVPGGPPERGSRLAHGPVPRTAWSTLLALATVVLVLTRLPLDLSTRLADHHLGEAAAALVTALLVTAVAHRVGGRPFVSLLVGLVLGAAAVATGSPEVTAGVAAATAVAAGLLAVLTTVPARGAAQVLREVVVAAVVSGVGALAVSAYGAGVEAGRFRYLALGVALVGSLAVAGRVGSGLHGLSPRASVVVGLAVVLVVVAVVYGEALSRWGSADLVDALARVRSTLRDHLGAVPHPIQVLVGWPALVYGVWLRARRPHAWWVCAFGVAATVPLACSLLDPMVTVHRAFLGALYSLVLGLVLGAVLIAVDRVVADPRGRRASRSARGAAIRPEPGRTRALV